MGSKGGGTTVMLPQMQAQTTSVAPNPVALAGYANVVGQAQDLQAQHQGFTPDQQQAFNQVQQLQGVANPWINQAGGFAQQGLGAGNALINSGASAGSPSNFGQNINAYMSPYMDDVVKATMANINETNAQQQSQLTGNAIAQGALGGNRVGVAGSELARQQNLTNNATLAQILQQGYGQAGQNLFQNAGLQMQAGNSLGSLGNQTAGIYSGLGNEALSTGLQGTNALLQTGGMQQALPYQQLGWLSGIVNNTGPNMGSTGTQNSMGFTSQYAPQPNLLNSIIGGGVAAAGAFLPRARGGAVPKAHGGGLGEYDPRSDDYDSPVGGGFGSIPEVRPTNAHGLQLPAFLAMQQAHQGQQEQNKSPNFTDDLRAGQGLRRAYDRYGTGGGGGEDFGGGGDEVGGDILSEARGGRVRGYDDGGEVIDDTATNPDPFSDEGGVRAPRSVRNNNPGNIEDGPFARGLPGYKGGDGRFAVFDSPDSGVGAQDRLLESYGKRGFNTPAAIVGRWAPAAENGGDSTNRYVSHVSQKLGVDPNTPLDMSDPNVRAGVRSAMAEYEAGTNGQTRALAYANPGEGGGGLGAINAAAPIAEGRSADTGVALPDAEPGFLERLGVPKISPDTRAALISAGLGMMASKSHWLGPAIGEGGLQGLKTYYQNQQNTRQNLNTQSEIANRAGLLGVAQQRNRLTAEQLRQQGINIGSEVATRAGHLGIETRQQDLQETLKNIQIKGAQESAKALRDFYDSQRGGGGLSLPAAPVAGGLQPAPVGGVGGGTGSVGGGGGTDAAVPANQNVSGAAPQRAPASELTPGSSPLELDRAATAYERSALAAGMVGDSQKSDSDLKHAQMYRQQAEHARTQGIGTDTSGRSVPLPGAAETKYQLAGSASRGEAAGKAPYEIKEVAGPNGETYYQSVADIVDQNGKAQSTPITSSAGAGTPTSGPPISPVLAKQPAVMAKRQEAIATNEQKMTDSYQARQIARERYETLAGILSKYQTGKFAENKASMVASLRAIGIPVTNKDTANPAAFEQFTKNAMKNVFSDVHDLGGKVLVAEITGLQRSTANPDLQPEANKAILGQAIGLLNYEDQYHDDYFNWKRQNPYVADTSAFDTQWVKAHPVKEFVKAATSKIGALGEQLPAPADRENGQVYSIPANKEKGVKAHQRQWINGQWAPNPYQGNQ